MRSEGWNARLLSSEESGAADTFVMRLVVVVWIVKSSATGSAMLVVTEAEAEVAGSGTAFATVSGVEGMTFCSVFLSLPSPSSALSAI